MDKMQKIINCLNGLYAEFVGLLFRRFLPKQSYPTIEPEPIEPEPEPEPEPIEPEPEPIEPEPIEPEPEPVDIPKMGIFGLKFSEGWD
jgi:hypothetical protein